jgi:hypothetical protein
MTGRAAGYCAGYGSPGFMNPVGGRLGMGFRRGRGRWWGTPYSAPGWGAWSPPYYGGAYTPYAPAVSAEQEKEALQNQVKFFEDQLSSLRERIEELEAETAKKG